MLGGDIARVASKHHNIQLQTIRQNSIAPSCSTPISRAPVLPAAAVAARSKTAYTTQADRAAIQSSIACSTSSVPCGPSRAKENLQAAGLELPAVRAALKPFSNSEWMKGRTRRFQKSPSTGRRSHGWTVSYSYPGRQSGFSTILLHPTDTPLPLARCRSAARGRRRFHGAGRNH